MSDTMTDDLARQAKFMIMHCADEIMRVVRGEGELISVRYPLSFNRIRDIQDLAMQIIYWSQQLKKEFENEAENTD